MLPCTRLLVRITVFLLINYSGGAIGQELFSYGGRPVSRAEFLNAYSRNANNNVSEKNSYRDYLELYLRYKLKIQAALDLKLDTLASQQEEIDKFRELILPSFMSDKASIDLLVNEAVTRLEKDVRISHIFIPVSDQGMLREAEKTINKAYQELKNGTRFDLVAKRYSKDPSVEINSGDLGFITVFLTPYAFETTAYQLQEGKFSTPFRTAAGFHIVRKTGERKAVGRIRIAQILLAFPPGASSVQQQQIKNRADSLYKIAKAGGDFGNLVRQFSDDNLSYMSAGELPEFGIGTYEPIFEKAAFDLKEDGELSKPIETSFGYHIIKRLQRKDAVNSSDADWLNSIRDQVQASDRMEIAEAKLIADIQRKIKFKRLPFDAGELMRYADNRLHRDIQSKITDKTSVIQFDTKNIVAGDWVEYMREVNQHVHDGGSEVFENMFTAFVNQQSLDHYRKNIERYSPEFVAQMQEFREGNLLFEVMQRKVWDAAANDSASLLRYYLDNKGKYNWEASADAIIITCDNDSISAAVKKALEAAPRNYQEILKPYEELIRTDSGRFELHEIPVAGRTNFTEFLVASSVKNENDHSVSFALILKVYPNPEPRTFKDAQGFVMNDYQLVLEEEWIAALKKKYPVKVNEAVFKSLK